MAKGLVWDGLSVQEAEARINSLGCEGCLFLQAAQDFSITKRNGDSGGSSARPSFIPASSQPLSTSWA